MILFFYSIQMSQADTFLVRLVPPKRKSATHLAAFERMKRFLAYASREDISEELKTVKPHKRVRYLVDKYEATFNEHIPISKVYKALRNSDVISTEGAPEPQPTLNIEPTSYISETLKVVGFESD